MLTEEILREQAGETEFLKGQALFHRTLVREARRAKEEIIYMVSGEEKHQVRLSAAGATCDCGEHRCAHAVAATLTAQLEMGAMMQIGAAVASMRYASFSREIRFLSVTGRITEPTVRQLK